MKAEKSSFTQVANLFHLSGGNGRKEKSAGESRKVLLTLRRFVCTIAFVEESWPKRGRRFAFSALHKQVNDVTNGENDEWSTDCKHNEVDDTLRERLLLFLVAVVVLVGEKTHYHRESDSLRNGQAGNLEEGNNEPSPQH